jgi:aryl-alcohol dehydrogenase-like predicted oxidoreductase
MKFIKLGSTDMSVSCVGLGTVKFGRNQGVKYPQAFELPSDKAIQELLACAQDLGINLLDTAPAYGISEERLGKIVKNRKEWIVCTKAGEEFVDGDSVYEFSPEKIRKSVERSLQRLKTDYLDIVLVHSNGDDKKIIEEDGALQMLAELKKAGLIRAFGMSTKTIDGGMLAVDQSDVVMVTYNPVNPEDRPVIAHAHEKKKGIFIKKALASGHLDKISKEDPVMAAMQFIFQEPGVTSVILGTLSPNHLKHNVECAVQALIPA